MFKGSNVALITPFKNNELDVDAYLKLIHFHLENGTNGLVPAGTTGESPTLNHKEHEKVIEICINEAKGKIPIIAGTGSNSTEEAVSLTKHAEKAGADIVGGKDLATKVSSEEKLDADIVISTPEMMAEVGQLGKILGPQGLMPNPKTGTVTPNVAKAVEDFKKGKVEIKNDKLGNIHLSVGKVSFEESSLLENLNEVIAEVNKAKPASAKGIYFCGATLSATVSPGIPIETSGYEK